MISLWNSLPLSCDKCARAWQVVGDPKDIGERLQIKHNCPYSCGGNMVVNDLDSARQILDNPEKYDLRTISFAEYVRAVAGAGLPEEVNGIVPEINRLCRTGTAIKKVKGKRRQDGTLQLSSIIMADDTVIHLGAGAAGAVVYRISAGVSDAQS